MNYLLDTNHWSYLQRREAMVVSHIQSLPDDATLYMPVVAQAELLAGVELAVSEPRQPELRTLETYRKLVQHMLQAHANEEGGAEGVEVQLVFDAVHDHYQLWYIGWQGEHRIRGCVLQVDIKDGKIWIQYDGTETGLACALVQAGVPKEDIVLAFHAPHKRPYTGYAVA